MFFPTKKTENPLLCMKMSEIINPSFLDVLDSSKVNNLLHMAVKALLPDLCNDLISIGANVQGGFLLFELFSHSCNENVNDVTIL